MELYLPIAEMPVDAVALVLLGALTGILSGLFGVGGGFLTTPLLIFMGIPPTVAVASTTTQMIASSFSGFLNHWRNKNVDFRMGMVLLAGGAIGSTAGVSLLTYLKQKGQADLVISLAYVLFLGTVGALMGWESWRSWKASRGELPPPERTAHHNRLQRLPFKMRFPRSRLYISALLPLVVGVAVGLIVSTMGIGGGLLMIPAMIYLLGMPTSVVVGTSLFQIMLISIQTTLLHATTTHSVDLLLAGLLLVGSAMGAQFGVRLGGRFAPETLRGLLAITVLAVALRLGWALFVRPEDLYTVIATLPNE